MSDRHMPPRHGRHSASLAPIGAVVSALVLTLTAILPAAAADPSAQPTATPTASPTPTESATPSTTPSTTPIPTPSPDPTAATTIELAADPLVVTMSQSAIAGSYDPSTNKARIEVTVDAAGAVAPWQYSVAVRGTTVASGSSSAASVAVTVTNNCSITTQSVTAQVTDADGRTAGTSATLDRSLCPPPPNYPHARDRILAGPTLTETSFVDRLRAVGSPAISEGRSIYRTLIAGGVNPAFALGTFHAESHSGTRGYATVTKNWGNILYYDWTAAFGATPYAPGNGYTYAKFPTWLHSIRAYVDLLQRYDRTGYTTVSSASARWLGTIEGSDRHLRYLNNITAVMRILPDDAVPVMTALSVPATSRADVRLSISARDNLGVTGYQIRKKRGTSGAWTYQSTTSRTPTITLTTGWWTIGVRATDAAGNWSRWRYDTVSVDAVVPTLTALKASQTIVRSVDGRFSASWSGTDNKGVTRYQWRTRGRPAGATSGVHSTTARSAAFRFPTGSWDLEVRAVDAVGNASPWRALRIVVPRDDRAFAFSTGNVRRAIPTAYRGTLTANNIPGSELTVTGDGDAFYVVGRVGPAYGRMRITVDGVSTIVDTGYYQGKRATENRDRVLLFGTYLAPGTHTVTITNVGSAARVTVAIDALDFAQ
jgi:hypothetical protein